MERWPSGRRRTTGNRVTLNRVPGFKSLSLRQKSKRENHRVLPLAFLPKRHDLNPRISGTSCRDMHGLRRFPERSALPLAQTWVRKSLSRREAPDLNPRMSDAERRDMLVCAGYPNAFRDLWRKHGFVNPSLALVTNMREEQAPPLR